MKCVFLIISCTLTVVAVNGGYLSSSSGYSPNSYLQNGANLHQYSNGNSYLHGISSGGSYGHNNHLVQEEHVPIIKNGVPVETPEVQAAKAQFFEAYAKASALAAQQPSSGKYEEYSSGDNYHYQPQYYATQPKRYLQGSSHYQSNALAYSPEIHNSGYYSTNQYVSNKGPVDTPEVQQAKAEHFAAYAQAQAKSSPHQYRRKRGIYGGHYDLSALSHYQEHTPVIGKNGVPIDTLEVQTARAQHLLAHAHAKSTHAGWEGAGISGSSYEGGYGSSYGGGHSLGSDVQYTVHHGLYGGYQKYHGPEHIPIIGKDGVPIDTPEVQAARTLHLIAHAAAKSGQSGGHGWAQQSDNHGWAQQSFGLSSFGGGYDHHGPAIGPNGVPIETPEVQLAKAQHFAAHAAEKAKHSQWAGQSSYGGSSGYHY